MSWESASLGHYAGSHSVVGAGFGPSYDPPAPVCPDCYHEYCICEPVDRYYEEYREWWEEQVALGLIGVPE